MENNIKEELERIEIPKELHERSRLGILQAKSEKPKRKLKIEANGGEELNNRKVNYRIDSFLSHKETFEQLVDVKLSELTSMVPETVSLDMDDIPGGGGLLFHQLSREGIVQVLKPNQNIISLPGIDFMHISNIGIIDHRLHIQANWTENGMDDHGYFYFITENGNEVHPSNIYFGANDLGQTHYGRGFTEYIFSIDDIDFDNDTLMAYLVSSEKFTIGNWSITFRMQDTGEEIRMDFNQTFGNWTSDTVSISPLGITIYGNGDFNNANNMKVTATMSDGSSLAFDSLRSFSEKDKLTLKFLADGILDISKIERVTIGGIDIFIQ